jgi:hypothetical protein
MKSLLLALLLLSTVHAQQAALKPVTGKKVALVIGNNGYTASPLKNCVSDATAIAKLLREQLNFDTVLADRDSENLGRLAFTRRIQAFQKEAQGAAVAVFYYAGHGMEDFDGRDNYLIPVDADLAEAAKDNAGLQAQGIPLEFVLKTMKEATQGAKIILLDCCRERPADRAIQTRDGGGFVMPTDSLMPQDTLIMLAAAPARTASDGEGHGPFTAALIKHLPSPGTALFQTFRTVRNEVLTATNQQQKPWLKLDGAGDFFYDHVMVVASAGSNRPTMPQGVSVIPSSSPAPEALRDVTKAAPFTNSLGMKFVPVLTYKGGEKVLFSIWETRSKDYAAFVTATSYDAGEDWKTYSYKEIPVGRGAGEDAEESSHPVANVSHDDGVAFCVWLTKKDRASGLIGPKDEYRLPTDNEWSYAVGIVDKEDASATPKEKSEAGKTKLADIYPWGGSFTASAISGNYADEDAKARGVDTFGVIEGYHDKHATTAPVGSFTANSFGLYDLGGNLWEWTSSEWEPGSPSRVLRGGSWYNDSESSLLSSYRVDFTRGNRYYRGSGFRCVLVVVGGG